MEDKSPPRVEPKLQSNPRIRQLYWCRFPKDAELPEVWKTRPVIIISKNNSLYGAVTVIPCTTLNQGGMKWSYEMRKSIDDRKSWAICDKPTTVAVSRLTQDKWGIKRISADEFNNILSLVYEWLPAPK